MLANKAACILAAVARAATVARGVASARSPCHCLPASAIAAPLSAPVVAALFSTSTHAAHFERTTASAVLSGRPDVHGIGTSAPLHADQASTEAGPERTLLAILEGGKRGSEVEVVVDLNWSIARVKEKVAEKIARLKDVPLEDITLHLEEAGGAGTSTLSFDALDGGSTVMDALPAGTGVTRTVVKVAPTAKPTAATISPGSVDERTRQFMQALPRATVEHLDDGSDVITLPDAADGRPICWPNMLSNKLFVRSIFRDFYEKPEHLDGFQHNVKRLFWLLRGIPGIGKSSFGLYCLWRLVKDGRRVRYWYPRGCKAVMDFGSDSLFDAYIVDGAAPETLMGTPTLLISSSRGGTTLDGADRSPIYDDFEKHPLVQDLFLPPPTVSQLLLLGSTCYPTVPKNVIRSCAKRWGPVIRPIFALDRDKEQEALKAAIQLQKISSLKDLARSMSEKVVIRDVSFRVVHYDIDEKTYHRIKGFKWGSPYIEQQVFEVLQLSEERDRLGLLQEMLTRTSSLAMCHKLFEDWCNVVMQRGSGGGAHAAGFRVRRLGIGQVQGVKGKVVADDAVLQEADNRLGLSQPDQHGIYRLKVQPANTLFLQTADELAPHAVNQLKLTRWKAKACFAAADFVEATGFCSNATVSDNHTLLLQGARCSNGLRAILEHLQPSALADDSKEIVPFVWLVPALVFPNFTVGKQVLEVGRQDARDDDGSQRSAPDDAKKLKAARETARQLGRRVVQYVLEIPNPRDYEAAGGHWHTPQGHGGR